MCYQNEPRFNGVFSRDNLLLKIKDGSYVINLDEYADVPEEIEEFIGNKNVKTNIFRVQANDSVMSGYFCRGFIDFMLAGKKLTVYTNLYSPHDFKKKDSIILYYLKNERK